MLIKQYLYPLDISGTAITNKITGERRTISPGAGLTYNFFIPRAAPFFGQSLVVRHVASGTTLTPGVDFEPSYKFLAASNTAGSDVFGSISILNTSYTGTFEIDYQTLGGQYTYDEHSLLEILAATQLDPRVTRWESIVDDPTLFPSDDHLHHAADSVGYDDMVAALNRAIDAFNVMRSQIKQYIDTHINDLNNPHQVDLFKLGIERFANVFKATINETVAGINNENFTTPAGVAAALAALLNQIDVTHFQQRNPHGTTASDVGLGAVQNYGIATQEDITSLSNAAYMTPATVATMVAGVVGSLPTQAIALLQQALAAHIADKDNPHEVKSEQLNIKLANSALGLPGTVPFYLGTAEPFDYSPELMLNNVAIVPDAGDLTLQLAARTLVADHFAQGLQLSWFDGSLVPDTTTPGMAWSFVTGTSTVVGGVASGYDSILLCPDEVYGNYSIEGRVSSATTGFGAIGFCLGLKPAANGYCGLFVYRDVSSTGGTLSLVYKDGNSQIVIAQSTAFAGHANGWSGYAGTVLVKAARNNNTLTLNSGVPGGASSVTLTVNMLDFPELVPFLGNVNLGYSVFNQAAANWTTVVRSDAQPAIVALHNSAVHLWNGTAYVVSTKQVKDILRCGRHYRNPTTKRIYFVTGNGLVRLLHGDATAMDYSKPSVVHDRLVYVGTDGKAHGGVKYLLQSQHPASGVITKLGGIGAETGKVGFLKADETFSAYIAADGRWCHYGQLFLSDPEVKNISESDELPFEMSKLPQLKLTNWEWKIDPRIPSTLHQRKDFGVLTSQVKEFCPDLVHKNDEGLEVYEADKLNLVLGITAHQRLDRLERLSQLSDAQLDKLFLLLKE